MPHNVAFHLTSNEKQMKRHPMETHCIKRAPVFNFDMPYNPRPPANFTYALNIKSHDPPYTSRRRPSQCLPHLRRLPVPAPDAPTAARAPSLLRRGATTTAGTDGPPSSPTPVGTRAESHHYCARAAARAAARAEPAPPHWSERAAREQRRGAL